MVSYSQSGQDLFVLYLCGKCGYFLDIGCGDPFKINNTIMLESLGWNGLLIDVQQECIDLCRTTRKAKAVVADLMVTSIASLLTVNNCPMLLDYISLDVDSATEKAFDGFPFNNYRFKVMTLEHDVYKEPPTVRSKTRQQLVEFGYVCVCKDVKNDGNCFEDWWVNPTMVNNDLWSPLLCENTEWQDIIQKIQ